MSKQNLHQAAKETYNVSGLNAMVDKYIQWLWDKENCTVQESWDNDIEYTQHECRDFIAKEFGIAIGEGILYNEMCDILVKKVK